MMEGLRAAVKVVLEIRGNETPKPVKRRSDARVCGPSASTSTHPEPEVEQDTVSVVVDLDEVPVPVPPGTLQNTLFEYFCGEVLRTLKWRLDEEDMQSVVMNDYAAESGEIKVGT